MTSPLAPPPPTGQPIDRWLYLLWRKLTATGQLFWSSIAPGTSADVAAAVTDETGSPGSLVFSGNPTLQGAIVDGNLYVGNSSSDITNAVATISSENTTSTLATYRRYTNTVGVSASVSFLKAAGTAASPATIASGTNIGAYNFFGHDGTTFTRAGQLLFRCSGTVSSGIVPGDLLFLTADSAGVLGEGFRVDLAKTVTLGGPSTSPALKVIPDATPSTQRRVEITAGAAAGNPTIGVSGGKLACSAALVLSQTTLIETSVALTNGAAAAAGTLLNAPAAGNPTKWIPINDNGTTRYIPAW